MDPDQSQPPSPPAAPPPQRAMPTMPDAPDKEKMEQIRARRLAKLGGNSSKPSDSSSSKMEKSEATEGEKSTEAGMAGAKKGALAPGKALSSANPFSAALKPTAQPSSTADKQGAQDGPDAQRQKRRSPTDADNIDTSKPPARKPNTVQSVEDFADKALTEILRVTVDPEKTTDSSGNNLALLPDLSAELAAEGSPLKLSASNIDQAILEAATALPHDKPLLSYLLPCWSRAQSHRSSPPRDGNKEKLRVLTEAKRLCISYCILALTMPAYFQRDYNESHGLVPHLLRDPTHLEGVDFEFIHEAILRFPENDELPDVFTNAMISISRELSHKNMEYPYQKYLNAMTMYCRFPVLLENLAKHESFNAQSSARGMENDTFLGPFFKLSPVKKECLAVYFPSPRAMDRNSILRSQDAVRQIIVGLQNDLFNIVNCFVRAGKVTRSKLLDWFARIMNTNHKRRAMQVDPAEVASDGFMLNINAILDRLCLPVTDDKSFTKVGNIDINYFRQNPRIDIKDETKLNADQAQSDAFYAAKVDGEPGFISELFFLTLASHHYGLEGAISKLKTLDREIKFYTKHVAEMEEQRSRHVNTWSAAQLATVDRAMKKHVDAMERVMRLKMGLEGLLLDPRTQGPSLSFLRYVVVWIVRVASQTKYNPNPLKGKEGEGETPNLTLPLPETTEAFACLPEYVVQNVVDDFKFCYKNLPNVVDGVIGDEMIALCVSFLQCSDFIKNPYMKASLVSLLFMGTWPLQRGGEGLLVPSLRGAKFANNYLLHALLKFYIECESTGTHTQFYDKFNIRYEIFQIIKCVWEANDVYKRQLTHESQTNRPFFVRFVNLLLNDATYVLDEAMSKFPKIHDLEAELRGTLSQEDRQKKDEELQRLAETATSYMQLANETLDMMKHFTKALLDAFTMPEIVQRLASMLNYNLTTLAGPKAGNLKVENAEKYHFRPRELLSDFIDIYLNLGPKKAFVEAVAADGRSYKPETFEKAAIIVQHKMMKDPNEVKAFNNLRNRFHQAYIVAMQAETDLGEIPAEFEDPISAELMKDPVTLPSKQIVDRSTISQHLLSDPMDPFTRQPMTIDDVIPNTELKAKIDAWKAERIAAAQARIEEEKKAAAESHEAVAKAADAKAADAMDTSED